jgi:hypothetical protein
MARSYVPEASGHPSQVAVAGIVRLRQPDIPNTELRDVRRGRLMQDSIIPPASVGVLHGACLGARALSEEEVAVVTGSSRS